MRLVPEDLAHTTAALFATRVVTHVCAPAFVFLAGASAFLHGRRLSSRAALARYLLTRGLWLIALELTVVNAAWQLSFTSGFVYVQVIAAIGAGMVGLGLLVALPPTVVGLIGLAIVAGHNLFDGVDFPPGTLARDLWTLAHVDRDVRVLGKTLVIVYPLLPWLGVMALGYGYGPVLLLDRTDRRGIALRRGLLLVILFVALRAFASYGDPHPYVELWTRALSCMAFLNCTKYPPSLQYVAMTLGPVLIGLALFDRPPGWVGRRLATLGRVPLFFYVVHVLLLAAASVAFYEVTLGVPYRALRDFYAHGAPPGYGNGLGTVYLAWAGCVLALYPLCAWYAGVKRRSRSPLLTYL
jgi:uncharacterized membrane protein